MIGYRIGVAVGVSLLVVGVLLLWWSLRRLRAEVAAELAVGVARVPARRLEAVTAIVPRVRDVPDATAVLPRVREVQHG